MSHIFLAQAVMSGQNQEALSSSTVRAALEMCLSMVVSLQVDLLFM